MTRSRFLPVAVLLFVAAFARAADSNNNNVPVATLGVPTAVPAAPTPEYLAKVAGYATVDQIRPLSQEDRDDLVAIIQDQTWAVRHVDYLRSVEQTDPASFARLTKDKQGTIYLDWLAGRQLARAKVKALAGTGEVSESDKQKLQDFAIAGFLSPTLAKAILGDHSPVLANLTGHTAGLGPDALNRIFDNASTHNGELARDEQSVVLGLKLDRLHQQPAPVNDLENLYQTGHQMILDPEGFRKKRPDVATASTPDEIQAQNNLAAKVGHVYRNIDQLRAQGRFEMEYGDEHMGNAMMDTSIVDVPGPNGALSWKIRVRVNPYFKNVDPVLTASIMTHEFLHAYDMTTNIQKFGLDAAHHVPDFQEEEMRAFTTESHVDIAYGSAIDRLAKNAPWSQGARVALASSMALRQLGGVSNDPKAYNATLQVMAQSELERRGYITDSSGINDVATALARFETTHERLQIEKLAASQGSEGLDRAIAQARQSGDGHRLGLLLMQKTMVTRPLANVEADIAQNEGVVRALKAEKQRGLALEWASGLTTTAPPPAAR